MNTSTIILIAAAAIALIAVVCLFNTLIGRKNNVANAFASIDAMLKKRFDLIPNLAATVEKYMSYEGGVLLAAGALILWAIVAAVHSSRFVGAFTPSFWRRVDDTGRLAGYYNLLGYIVGMVDDLNLNTRIWSKLT